MNFKINTQKLLYLISETDLPGIAAHKDMSFTNRNFEKPDNAVHSAVAIVLFEYQNEIFFPLIKRPMYIKYHKGQIALPGGKTHINENVFECAVRETEEEIGINKNNIKPVRQLTELYIPVSNHLVFPILCYSTQIPSFSYVSEEVDKLIWCSITDLLSFEKQTAKVKITDNIWIEAPAFIYKGETIWGATALILNELREMILKIKLYDLQ